MRRLILSIFCLAALASCRNEDPDGPNLNDLFGPFSIIQAITPSIETVDFVADGDLVFNGELSKNTDWTITLRGATTGALRTITGFDRIFSAETASWDGGANTFPAFGTEDVYVEIVFPNEPTAPIVRDTITITGVRADVGFLITSFENGFGAQWTNFNQTTVTGGIDCSAGDAAKGNCQYSFSGVVGWDWAIGSVMVRPDNGTFNLPANATNLFMNLAFKAVENIGPSNSFIQFWFDEDDNGNGSFEEATEDRFIFDYWSQDSTWNIISKNYASLQFDEDGNQVMTNGNGLPEPSKLVAINIFFLANPNNGLSTAQVDHLIFTTDQPYTP